MSLKLIYITNKPEVALIAEKNGVDSIMVDLETLGKEQRQRGMNTVKSHHSFDDIKNLSRTLTKSELLVRINPWNPNSEQEIEKVIACGADRIMLPMWKTAKEVDMFLKTVNNRCNTILLLETKEAVQCLDEVLENSLPEQIHIGLNDLHLSFGLTFMFELLTNGTVGNICMKCREKGISYGFGGIAKIGEGMLPAERIVMEHYRLRSSRTILSRSFCNAEQIGNIDIIEKTFCENMKKLRKYEESLKSKTQADYVENAKAVEKCVLDIVSKMKEEKTI